MWIFWMLVVAVVWGCIWGAVTYAISQHKGNEGGFWWGFWLGIIVVIVVAVKKSKNERDVEKLQGLKTLKELMDAGLISQEEFEVKKSELLK